MHFDCLLQQMPPQHLSTTHAKTKPRGCCDNLALRVDNYFLLSYRTTWPTNRLTSWLSQTAFSAVWLATSLLASRYVLFETFVKFGPVAVLCYSWKSCLKFLMIFLCAFRRRGLSWWQWNCALHPKPILRSTTPTWRYLKCWTLALSPTEHIFQRMSLSSLTDTFSRSHPRERSSFHLWSSTCSWVQSVPWSGRARVL